MCPFFKVCCKNNSRIAKLLKKQDMVDEKLEKGDMKNSLKKTQ